MVDNGADPEENYTVYTTDRNSTKKNAIQVADEIKDGKLAQNVKDILESKKQAKASMAQQLLPGLYQKARPTATSKQPLLDMLSSKFKQPEVIPDKTIENAGYTYNQRGLIILIDDSEGSIDAVGQQLLTALSQEAGPIIASRKLLHNIFSLKSEDYEGNIDKSEWYWQRRLYHSGDIKAKDYITVKSANIQEAKWIFKKINNDFYLLIPKVHLQELGINESNVETEKLKTISQVELQLGLKVNHMDTASIDDIIDKESTGSKPFPSILLNIFCTRSDYKNTNINLPKWSFFMAGHGATRDLVVGMSLSEFKDTLIFFKNKINTKLLVYQTCYAGGENLKLIYEDAKKAIQKTYPFTIITCAITDAMTQERALDVTFTRESSKLKTFNNYASFLKTVTQKDHIKYEKILQSIFSNAMRISTTEVPQIKLPGIEWFSILDSKNVVSLESILVKGRSPEKALNVSKFFRKDSPHTILLHTEKIPFELIINSKKDFPKIVSMIQGDASHILKKITSQTHTTEAVVAAFMKFADRGLMPQKKFYIEQVRGTDKTINKVYIYSKGKGSIGNEHTETYAYFTLDNNYYKQVRGAYDEPYIKSFKDEFDQYKIIIKHWPSASERPQLVSIQKDLTFDYFSFDNHYSEQFTLSTPTIIQSIQAIGQRKTIDNLFSDMKSKIRTIGNFVWIRKVIGEYKSSFDLKIEGINNNKVITVTDVIIEKIKDDHNVFFTYEGTFYHGRKKIIYDYKDNYKERVIRLKRLETIKKALSNRHLIKKRVAEGFTKYKGPSKNKTKIIKDLPKIKHEKKMPQLRSITNLRSILNKLTASLTDLTKKLSKSH